MTEPVEKIRLLCCKNELRYIEKIRLTLYERTKVRRNLEKIILILTNETKALRNVEKIRLILYQRTNDGETLRR